MGPEWLVRLWDQGFSAAEIATQTELPEGTVRRYLVQAGLRGTNYNWFKRFTLEQRSVLIGTLLGDGHVDSRPRLRWAHCLEQVPYLLWKARVFGSLFQKLTPREERNTAGSVSYALTSRQHPVFSEFRSLFYLNGKKQVSVKILSEVNDLALAVWWMDDGTVWRWGSSRDRRLELCLGGLPQASKDEILRWFTDKGWKFETFIYSNSPTSLKVRFGRGTSWDIFLRIKNLVPPEMQFKIQRFEL